MSCGLTRQELVRFDIPVVRGICKGPRPDGTTCDDPASAHSSGKIKKFIPRSDRRLAESNFLFFDQHKISQHFIDFILFHSDRYILFDFPSSAQRIAPAAAPAAGMCVITTSLFALFSALIS